MKITPNWPPMQEMFNTVWNHFVVNKSPPSVHGGFCEYFNESTGARCAVGLLLSPEDAKRIAQINLIATSVEELTAFGALEVPEDILPFVTLLQSVHDNSALSKDFYESFVEGMRSAAVTHGLTVPE